GHRGVGRTRTENGVQWIRRIRKDKSACADERRAVGVASGSIVSRELEDSSTGLRQATDSAAGREIATEDGIRTARRGGLSAVGHIHCARDIAQSYSILEVNRPNRADVDRRLAKLKRGRCRHKATCPPSQGRC